MRGPYLRHTGAVARKEALSLFNDKGLLLLMLIAPMIQLIIFGYAATKDIRNITVAVLDEDRSALTRDLIRSLEASGYFLPARFVTSRPELLWHLDSGRARVGIAFPVGFTRRVQSARTGQIQVLLDGTDSNAASIILGYVNNIAQTLVARQLSRNLEGVFNSPFVGPRISSLLVDVRPRVWYNPELKSIYFMVPGIIGVILLTLVTDMTSLAFVKEREVGTLEQLIVTPLSGFALPVGKIAPYVLIGILDVVVVALVGWLWFGVWVRGDLLLLFGLCSLFILTSLGMGVFISMLVSTQEAARLLTALYQIPSILLSGFIFPVANMPELIQWFSYLLPFRYFLEIIRGIYLKGVGLEILWREVVALAGFALFTLLVTGFSYRRVLRKGLG